MKLLWVISSKDHCRTKEIVIKIKYFFFSYRKTWYYVLLNLNFYKISNFIPCKRFTFSCGVQKFNHNISPLRSNLIERYYRNLFWREVMDSNRTKSRIFVFFFVHWKKSINYVVLNLCKIFLMVNYIFLNIVKFRCCFFHYKFYFNFFTIIEKIALYIPTMLLLYKNGLISSTTMFKHGYVLPFISFPICLPLD